jgi:predicted nucleic acid-binding Zn finger protein
MLVEKAKKTDVIISEKRVKLHIFEPSKRQIWTVVGMGGEHWLAPEFDFCSCRGYYFGKFKKKKSCYHLESVRLAKQENDIEVVIFSDEEYSDFLRGLVAGL